jgi:hypothetical protein
MTTEYIGTTFNIRDQWGPQEKRLINSVLNQINRKFGHDDNLLINLTWFGPQFDNDLYQRMINLVNQRKSFDNLFWLSSVDPICLLPEQMIDIENKINAKQVFRLGGFDDSDFSFVFSSIATAEDFISYKHDEILLDEAKYLFLCYNRKPKPHRIELVEKICKNDLKKYGILTLGKNDVNYAVDQGIKTDLYFTVDEVPENYSYNNKFLVHKNFGGVPYDALSLGRLDIWKSHFLNIVSETEFYHWDNMFITEKTWKPILGLRPFIINGQITMYKYLRDNGFKTFTHYFEGIELEHIPEHQIHDSIIAVIRSLVDKDLKQLYQQMLPDLEYNRQRFFEFAQEQKYKIDNLFR